MPKPKTKNFGSIAVQLCGLLVVIAAIIAAIYFLGNGSSLTQVYNYGDTYSPSAIPPNPQRELLTYSVLFAINPNLACLGDWVTGTIDSTIPFGMCAVFIDTGTGPALLTTAALDANGDVSATQQVNTLGSAQLWAVCCDADGNCRVSNRESLTVITCPTPTTTPTPTPSPTPTTDWFCCYVMGLQSCYEGGCPPAGIEIGRYDSLADCAAECEGGVGDDDGDDQQQLPCELILPATPESCTTGACESGDCVYVEGTLVMPAKCECQGACSVGTTECAEKCMDLCGGDMISAQCGGGSCPLMWEEIIGEETCVANEYCDRCCCECGLPV